MFRLLFYLSFIVHVKSLLYDKPIFITGANSKLGQRVINKLNMRKVPLKCLVRNTQKAKRLFQNMDNVELVEGDILEYDYLKNIMKDCEMSVNLHSVNRVSNPFRRHNNNYDLITNSLDKNHPFYVNYIGMKNIIKSCKENNINKLIRTTERATGLVPYHPTSLLLDSFYSDQIFWHRHSEKDIISSGLVYTIIRPGGIHNKDYDAVELEHEIAKGPTKIGINNLADVIVRTILPSENHIEPEFPFENQIIACHGYNTPIKKATLQFLHP